MEASSVTEIPYFLLVFIYLQDGTVMEAQPPTPLPLKVVSVRRVPIVLRDPVYPHCVILVPIVKQMGWMHPLVTALQVSVITYYPF